MSRNTPKDFVIYEDPRDRVLTPGTEAAEIYTLRVRVEAISTAITKKNERLADAEELYRSARETYANCQFTEDREVSERIRAEKLIKKQEKLTKKLETKIEAVEAEMVSLGMEIGEREGKIRELIEVRGRLKKKVGGLLGNAALEQAMGGLAVGDEGRLKEQEREGRRLAGGG